MAACVGRASCPNLDTNAALLRHDYQPCRIKRRMACPPPLADGLPAPIIFENCYCNELDSLVRRHLIQAVRPARLNLALVRAIVVELARRIAMPTTWTPKEVALSFDGPKCTKYLRAAKSLGQKPFTERDAILSSFVKTEKSMALLKDKPPRLIQARNPRYNLVLGQWLRPLKSSIVNLCGNGRGKYTRHMPRTPIIVSGKTNRRMAEILLEKSSRFKNPVFWGFDAKHWDASVDVELLKIKHTFYQTIYRSVELQRVLKLQLNNRGVTKNGIKYRCRGKVCSGDMDTSDGNCIMNVSVMAAVMWQLDIEYDAIVNGDDAIIMTESGVVLDSAMWLPYGFEVELCGPFEDHRDVEFCQSRIIDLNGPCFVRNPQKVLFGFGYTYRNIPVMRQHAYVVAQTEYIVSKGVPVIEAASRAMMLACQTQVSEKFLKSFMRENSSYYYRVNHRAVDPGPITHQRRLDYERSFGVSIQQQLQLEASFESYKVDWPKAIDINTRPFICSSNGYRYCIASTPPETETELYIRPRIGTGHVQIASHATIGTEYWASELAHVCATTSRSRQNAGPAAAVWTSSTY